MPVLALGIGVGAGAQEDEALRLRSGEGSIVIVPIATDRGYAAVPLSTLEGLGWSVAEGQNAMALRGPEGTEVLLRPDSPFFRWNDDVLQAADAPYRGRGTTMIPLQLLTDFMPRRLPAVYEFDRQTRTLRITGAGFDGLAMLPSGRAVVGLAPGAVDPGRMIPDPPAEVGRTEFRAPSPYTGTRVVVIDAGHGGADPGALGPGGVREKTVALGVAKALANILEGEEGLEVVETRKGDVLVPIWDRGELATEAKGERPGIFVSIHANSSPSRPQARGFETYFLSEARTEHERRVAAIENAPLQIGGAVAADEEPDLGFILRELRVLDHQHWSADLAELVQQELATFHSGPNRGVKQGLFAVLTNALMPSVLVEVGYLSNAEEGRVLGQPAFQQDAAEAIARAVLRFFARYPPGSGSGG